MTNKLWYAVLKDESDSDLGYGSYDHEEAMEMATRNNCKLIAHVDNTDEIVEMEEV